MRACFFAKVRSRRELDYIDFYAQDIQILKELGYEVNIATQPWEVGVADLYFTWWWTYAFFPVAVARLLRKPVIITGTFNLRYYYPQKPHWQRSLIDFSVRRASLNVAVSRLEFEGLKTTFPTARWAYIPHVVDTDLYSPRDGLRENFVYTTATMLPGNAERKCIPELMEAISIVGRLHPSVRFVLAGECHWKYQQMARELGVAGRIHFAGVVSKSQKIAFLGACMLYAQPSRFEGFGLGILEAMSCGAPIVTSRVGGVPEVVGGCGIYVDGCSAQSIGEGICRMIGDETLRTECGQAGRQRAVQMFSFSRRKLELAKCIGELGS